MSPPNTKNSKRERSVAHVDDRAGRRWTVSVTDISDDEAIEDFRNMTGDERVALIGECVLDGLRVKGKLHVPRLRRVYRVLERAPISATKGERRGGRRGNSPR
jgi:hypothetical protein